MTKFYQSVELSDKRMAQGKLGYAQVQSNISHMF